MLCGTPTLYNASAMCETCLRAEHDISEGVEKQVVLDWCRKCERWHRPPNSWMYAELESLELLSLALKRTPGLSKLKLVDASWIWTEPHSRRLKVRCRVRAERQGVMLEQEFTVEYTQRPVFCRDCHRVEAKQMGAPATVQVRQKNVLHKKTFYLLEQLILKHQAQSDVLGIHTQKGG